VDEPDPKIINRRDAIVKITSTAICGSDLHLYNGFIPTMEKGDILGHEFMGEVVEVGSEVKKIEGRRPRGGRLPDLVRRLLLL
jgi:threonine dehydrogenase-like Zn-dependent dehydrogenase